MIVFILIVPQQMYESTPEAPPPKIPRQESHSNNSISNNSNGNQTIPIFGIPADAVGSNAFRDGHWWTSGKAISISINQNFTNITQIH